MPDDIKQEAITAALAAGFYYENGSTNACDLRASLGRFEAEPWYLPYFYDAVMNGDGESFGSADHTDCDVLTVNDAEREAFEFDTDTVAVAVTYSDQGFVGLVELNERKLAKLEDSYQSEESDDY